MNLRRVEVSRRIRASAENLFKAWIDSAELALWWCREGPGWAFVSASVDARVGGVFRFAMRGPSGRTHIATGRYREIVPPARLVFSWDWEHHEDRTGETLVTVTFTPVDALSTEVRIVHEGFAADETMEAGRDRAGQDLAADAGRAGGHAQGWTELLGRLMALKEASR